MSDNLKDMDIKALEAMTLAGNRNALMEIIARAETRGEEIGETKARYQIFMQERDAFQRMLPYSCGSSDLFR